MGTAPVLMASRGKQGNLLYPRSVNVDSSVRSRGVASPGQENSHLAGDSSLERGQL